MARTELAVMDHFDLQAAFTGDMKEAIDEEMSGLGLISFDKVKIPSGGGLAFEVSGDEDEEPKCETAITGVILDHHPVNAYWAGNYGAGNGNDPPDCVSYDGNNGIVRETGEIKGCLGCPANLYGSGPDGRGKACKNAHRVYMLEEGNPVPIILSLPPTSLKYMRDYIGKRIVLKGLRCWQAVTKITLKKERNSAGISYSRAAFTFVGLLPAEDQKKAEAMKDYIRKEYRQVEINGADISDGRQAGGGQAPPRSDPDEFMNIPEDAVDELPFPGP